MIPASYPDRRVCVFGMGYVGLTLAAVLADVGFEVTGVEIRDEVVAALRRGEPHFHEPGLAELLRRAAARGRLRFARHADAENAAGVYIITVGTPLDASGRVRLDMIEAVSREVAGNLREGDLVIMRSTVKLGTTRRVVMPILDGAGVGYDIAFCPERTLEGQALPELRALPQIVGGLTPAANVRAAQFFQLVTPTVVRVSSIETAEMVKLVDNSSRDVAFAFANEVARLCDASGISATEIVRSGKLGYPRTNLPWPGPVGGPCLEKDSHILAEGARESGVEPEMTVAARRINERQPGEVVAAIKRATERAGFPDAPVVALLGIAFKGRPATDDLRGTMARPILAALRAAYPSGRFRGWDAVVAPAEIERFGLAPQDSIDAAMRGAHLVVIANNHPSFAAMPIERLAEHLARPGLVYDFWNNFAAEDLELPRGVGYMALGSHSRASLPGAGMSQRRYLVTGGAGFIGAALVRRLVAAGHVVRVLDDGSRGDPQRLRDLAADYELRLGDVRDGAAVAAAAEGMDGVIHLAAVNGTEFFYSRPELVLDVGVRGMLAVIDACRRHGIGDLVLASSSEVYQTPDAVPTDERAQLVVPDVANPRYSYGGAKIISELMALNYGRTGFDRVVVFRPHNVYGPDMGWEHVVPQFALRAAAAARAHPAGKVPFAIQGTGAQSRAFVHIDDFTTGLMLVIARGGHREIFHIGNEEEVTIAELARLVVARFGRDAELIPGSEPEGATPRRCPDIGKLRGLGFAPRIALRDGIGPVVDWYAANAHLRPTPSGAAGA